MSDQMLLGDHTPRLQKKLDFDVMSDEEEDVFSMELGDGPHFSRTEFSPAHTRSGRVYTTRSGRLLSKSRSRTCRGTRKVGANEDLHEDTGELADNEEMEEQEERKDFLFSATWEARCPYAIPSSPMLNQSNHQVSKPIPLASSPQLSTPVPCSSPPASSLGKLDLLESPNRACSIRLPTQSFSIPRLRSRLFSSEVNSSLPLNMASLPSQRETNINPFTPSAMLEARKRNWDSRFTNSSQSADSYGDSTADESDLGIAQLPAKRIKVSDMNVNRYNEEFLELSEIASGQFGVVKKTRHRLDGIVYAIKISRKKLRPNSRDERLGMNEIFAHAAMMKHKHVVRYFNSWVEGRRLYIQNEFCEGGSLEAKIGECRHLSAHFSEAEVRKLLLQVGRGLQYIHSKQLVHLDIKPANIFIAFNPEDAVSPHVFSHSPDSGAMSGDTWWGGIVEDTYGPTSDSVHYKIGDFGHVVSVQGVESGHSNPEEGDCRYMAPEFLLMGSQTGARLFKADMFSTGMTVFEVASMLHLPRNSSDSPDYEKMKRGQLPFLSRYTPDLNTVLKSLVYPDPCQRPTATRLLSDPLLNPLAAKSKVQLKTELRQTREKMLELERRVGQISNHQASGSTRPVGAGMRRSNSSNL